MRFFSNSLVLSILVLTGRIGCSQSDSLKEHVLFYSSFDNKTSADLFTGDGYIYSAKNYNEAHNATPGLHSPDIVLAKGKGIVGDALYFKKKNTSAVFYKAFKNVGYSSESWSGTISFWLQLDPNKDLAPGYCDPINITDVSYNDAAMWVDFTDGDPRKFRLGAMGDLAVWNPENKNNEEAWEKRTVTVNEPPFQAETWTHVVISYSEVNTDNSIFNLYLNGQLQGAVKDVNDPFTWEAKKGKIMLGLGYIGLMDELSLFDKALDATEVSILYSLENGIKSLLN